jgi:hypothetical protein
MYIPFSSISVDRKAENAQDQTLAGLRRNPCLYALWVRGAKREFAGEKVALNSKEQLTQTAAKQLATSDKLPKPNNGKPETQPFYLRVAGG